MFSYRFYASEPAELRRSFTRAALDRFVDIFHLMYPNEPAPRDASALWNEVRSGDVRSFHGSLFVASRLEIATQSVGLLKWTPSGDEHMTRFLANVGESVADVPADRFVGGIDGVCSPDAGLFGWLDPGTVAAWRRSVPDVAVPSTLPYSAWLESWESILDGALAKDGGLIVYRA